MCVQSSAKKLIKLIEIKSLHFSCKKGTHLEEVGIIHELIPGMQNLCKTYAKLMQDLYLACKT